MSTFDNIWEDVHKEKEWGKYPPEEAIRFVARNYYKLDRSKTKILDMGCGTGAISWYLLREGFRAYGFDGSATAVSKAKDFIKNSGYSGDFIVCDAGNLPYEDEFFDSAIDSAFIYSNTVNSIKIILKETYRILKSGGKIFSTGLFRVGMSGYGTGEFIEENTFRNVESGPISGKGTAHFFSENEIINLWSEAGFKNIKIDTLDRSDLGGLVTVSYFIVEAQK